MLNDGTATKDLPPIIHTRENYGKNLRLSTTQVKSVFQLIEDNPWLSNHERDYLEQWSNDLVSQNFDPEKLPDIVDNASFYHGEYTKTRIAGIEHHARTSNGINGNHREFILPYGNQAITDLLHYNPYAVLGKPVTIEQDEFSGEKKHEPQTIDFEKTIDEITKHTDFYIFGEELFAPQTKIPLELEYALGIGGNDLIANVKEVLERGDKIALMQVKELPPEVKKAIHTIVDTTGGSVDKALRVIMSDEETLDEDVLNRSPSLQEAVMTAREGARKLFHCKILSDNPKGKTSSKMNSKGEEIVAGVTIVAIEKRLNEVFDNHIDLPYAIWKYWDTAVSKDVQMATIALGASAMVGSVLTYFSPFLPEMVKKTIPPLIADIATNASAATPFVEENQPLIKKTAQLSKLLYTDFLLPLGVGAFSIPILAAGTQALIDTGYTPQAALVYSLVSLIPTVITTEIAKRKYAEEDSHGPQAMKSHPVQSALLPGSVGAAIASAGLVVTGNAENALLLAAATEAVEPLFTILLARYKLKERENEYRMVLSRNPRQTFLESRRKSK